MRIPVLPLILTCLVTVLSGCASDRVAGDDGDRLEPTTGSRIPRRDRPSNVTVMTREEYERARDMSSGGSAPPRN